MISIFRIYSDKQYMLGMMTKCTAKQQWPIWLLISGSREQDCFFSSFFFCYENMGMVIILEPHIFSARNCQICLFQMTFLLEANKSWWLNGARSHKWCDLSTEMRHKAKEKIPLPLPVSKDSAILLLSQQTAASWDPNR